MNFLNSLLKFLENLGNYASTDCPLLSFLFLVGIVYVVGVTCFKSNNY